MSGVSPHDHVGLAWACSRVAAGVYRRRFGVSLDVRDLVGAAWLGIARAAEKFEPMRGLRFSTYAMPFGAWAASECAASLSGISRRTDDHRPRMIAASTIGAQEPLARAVTYADFAHDGEFDGGARELLAWMRPSERAAVELTVLCGLSLKQAAEIVGCSPQAIHKARNSGFRRAAKSALEAEAVSAERRRKARRGRPATAFPSAHESDGSPS